MTNPDKALLAAFENVTADDFAYLESIFAHRAAERQDMDDQIFELVFRQAKEARASDAHDRDNRTDVHWRDEPEQNP